MLKKWLPPSTFLVLVIFTLFFFSCSRKPASAVYTGLRILKEFDKGRTFDTLSGTKKEGYFRPVKIDIFYPSAEKPAGTALTYGDLLDQYECRMNYSASPDSCRKTSQEIAGMITGYLHAESVSKLLGYRMDIYKGLRTPAEKSPLIIYASSMNGSSWENAVLFDTLAKHGYVVAAISSVGKYPGYMSEAVDLGEQVGDILFAKKVMSQFSYIDTSRIGLLSWSLGGTAATKAAMLSNDFKALLSCDGTEIHYYGADTAWDRQYKQITGIPPFAPGRISIPYLYLSSQHPEKVDSIYALPSHVQSRDKYFLRLNKSIHEDFSSIVTVAKAITPELSDVDSSRHALVCGLATAFFDQYLKPGDAGSSDILTTGEYINRLLKDKPASFDTAFPRK